MIEHLKQMEALEDVFVNEPRPVIEIRKLMQEILKMRKNNEDSTTNI